MCYISAMTAKDQHTELFYQLDANTVLDGIEAAGFATTGEYIQLNSYENRVFEVRLEKGQNPAELDDRIVAKYYRPLRWDQKALFDEHFFLEELKLNGIPVIAPLTQKNGQTLSCYEGIYLALFKKGLGRIPQELTLEQLKSIGRVLARIHNVGEQKPARFRPAFTAEQFGWPALNVLESWIAPEVYDRYTDAAEKILEYLDQELRPEEFIRIHGDCHKGNLLQKDERDGSKEFFFMDFDDFGNGPVAQDFWMLFSSDESSNGEELEAALSGYEELRSFPVSQRKLFAPLRGLRIIHYAGWIARRWEDPFFPKLFPQFKDYVYWAEEAEALERIAWRL
jgi:Ser/Thr protein kinase RdoA (MazF antagonist)